MAERGHQRCRSCGEGLKHLFVDLGASPISNALRRPEQDGEAEAFYPLRAFVCGACKLVQVQDVVRREDHFHADYA